MCCGLCRARNDEHGDASWSSWQPQHKPIRIIHTFKSTLLSLFHNFYTLPSYPGCVLHLVLHRGVVPAPILPKSLSVHDHVFDSHGRVDHRLAGVLGHLHNGVDSVASNPCHRARRIP
jgi:hypothetical protein